MLLLQDGELPLKVGKLLHLGKNPRVRLVFNVAYKHAILHLLSPSGEHEGMDVQTVCNFLDLHTWLVTQADSREFELKIVSFDFAWTRWRSHWTFFRLGEGIHFPG